MLAGFLGRPGDPIFDGNGVVEEAPEGVVIALQNRVELMVVAAGALHAGAEEDVTGGVGDVVEDIVPLAAGVAVVVFVDPVAKVAKGGERLGVAGEKFVARDLFLDEAVVRFVLVVGLDDVIAVAPGSRAEVVDAEAVAVGVAHEVEPSAAHALTVGGRGQEAVDEFLVGERIGGLDEGGDVFRRRGESGGVEGDAADEDSALGFAGRRQAILGESGVDETIDRVGRLTSGKFGELDGLIRPPAFFLRADGAREVATGDGRLGAALRPGRPGLNPILEESDFFLREPIAFWRHHHLGVRRENILEEEALGGVAGDERCAAVTTGREAG